MPLSRRDFLRGGGLAALGLSLGANIKWTAARPLNTPTTDPLIHVLNRITWGIRPEDLDKIKTLGIEGYIDWQLDYAAIADPAVDDLLGSYPILSASNLEIDKAVQFNYDNVFRQAIWARIYRAAYSERQLFEQMVEFWTDHFNIPIGDLLDTKIVDDRDVIRKHALGKFRDMLFASAQSPAMLYYLNNADSNKEHPNENYARELLELHTLGVDGGYTETDVKEVARALTGWQVKTDNTGNTFFFNMEEHDDGAKTILGHTFLAGRGIEDGLQLLDILATHSSTARFISYKLCRRFVSDTPPPSIVDSTAEVFQQTGGEIKTVMRHLLTSPEFVAAQWQKFRRPTNVLVAMLRVLHSSLTIRNEFIIWNILEPMGQLPYFWHLPDGYPDTTERWLNTNALLYRWNLALTAPLAAYGYLDGITFNVNKAIPSAQTIGELVDQAIQVVIAAPIDPADRQQLIAFVSDNTGDGPLAEEQRQQKLPSLLGLLMASPYFQWH